jgi:hypothetical protein
MSLRGRGLLEVKPSTNPFFQTTTSDIGTNPNEEIKWQVQGKVPPFQSGKHNVDGNFAFLYSRESDRIGSKVQKPVMKETRLLTKTEFLKKKREEQEAANMDRLEEDESSDPASPGKRTAEDILAVYQHVPKYEDPRYTTSTSEYGKKPPSVATLVTERLARPQAFSRSFQNIKPQNTSLTTSITRSNVHSSLDPQFA